MGSQSQTQLSDIHNSRLLERQATTNLDSILKSRDIIFVDKCPSSQSYGFSSGHVRMCELDIKKAECWRIDAFKLWCWRLFESPLDSREIKPVNPKGNQPWIFIWRTDTEAPILWPPDEKSQLIVKNKQTNKQTKNPDARKDWRQKEKRAAEDEIVRYHHQLTGHEFEQTLGDSEGQESLAWCSPRDSREWYVT